MYIALLYENQKDYFNW